MPGSVQAALRDRDFESNLFLSFRFQLQIEKKKERKGEEKAIKDRGQGRLRATRW